MITAVPLISRPVIKCETARVQLYSRSITGQFDKVIKQPSVLSVHRKSTFDK